MGSLSLLGRIYMGLNAAPRIYARFQANGIRNVWDGQDLGQAVARLQSMAGTSGYERTPNGGRRTTPSKLILYQMSTSSVPTTNASAVSAGLRRHGTEAPST
ncbi:hypothetical protein PspLS_03753 [Pyricularia sp. CBS 133598]|nr:hypothetical protein PspLS_03753 [Pyricularia sp. CBS 133598]